MDPPRRGLFGNLLKSLFSWVPGQREEITDFWMPDDICKLCYECATQFSLFNRRHHCRKCGQVFCSNCASNFVPPPENYLYKGMQEDSLRIRVCNFCFRRLQQEKSRSCSANQSPCINLSRSQSGVSLASTKSSNTMYSSTMTIFPLPNPLGSCYHTPFNSFLGSNQNAVEQSPSHPSMLIQGRDSGSQVMMDEKVQNQISFNLSRSNDNDDADEDDNNENGDRDSELRHFHQSSVYCGRAEFDEIDPECPFFVNRASDREIYIEEMFSSSHDDKKFHSFPSADKNLEDSNTINIDGNVEGFGSEAMDYEKNGLLWLPPEAEDTLYDSEVDVLGNSDEEFILGEFMHLPSPNRVLTGDACSVENMNAKNQNGIKEVVDGHFRALVDQLLQVEGAVSGEEGESESWLDIITSLSWEAGTFLKPDTSKGGGMDPGGYVKIKRIVSGSRSQSKVVKGVVCKKNVANRHMLSKIENPRILIIGGALEYQRAPMLLSSVDTLLQQEMDHLKMVVARIAAHRPDVLLVEKSVSRFAQNYLLAQNISLVLNIKMSILERIARCTNTQIIPSIHHLGSVKLGFCELFHVKNLVEEHGIVEQGGKRLSKNLMFFEGCPKPLGCTVLLMGANGDELKKIKNVIQYGVIAAYYLALETSFLADEGASLSECPMNSPLILSSHDKSWPTNGSISTISGFTASSSALESARKLNVIQPSYFSSGYDAQASEPSRTYTSSGPSLASRSLAKVGGNVALICSDKYDCQIAGLGSVNPSYVLNVPSERKVNQCTDRPSRVFSATLHGSSSYLEPRENYRPNFEEHSLSEKYGSCFFATSQSNSDSGSKNTEIKQQVPSRRDYFDTGYSHRDQLQIHEIKSSEDRVSPSGERQSILVSISTRCVWKQTICEPAHISRIRYYSKSDNPLGRILRDHLFDQSNRCRFCNMPPEAHVRCYIHREGSLTISVRELPDLFLPGEDDGRIWMWHRCLRCPPIDQLPPSTRRILMSDAAWGLSFGKFLELTFSNEAAASRVASCGHSIHKDCLRFYGMGKRVACFRYASISIHSLYLPPPMLDFNYEQQDWIQKEENEVCETGKLLFSEIVNVLEKLKANNLAVLNSSSDNNKADSELGNFIVQLEELLHKEKIDFEEHQQTLLKKEVRQDFFVTDILEVNKLRRQLLIRSYVWDRLLLYVSNPEKENLFSSKNLGVRNLSDEPRRALFGANATFLDLRRSNSFEENIPLPDHDKLHNSIFPNVVDQKGNVELGFVLGLENNTFHKVVRNDQSEKLTFSGLRRTLSDGQLPLIGSLSGSPDTKWRGQYGNVVEDVCPTSPSFVGTEVPAVFSENSEDRTGAIFSHSSFPVFPSKWGDSAEDFLSWIGISFLNFYRSFNRNSGISPRLHALSQYKPVYISISQERECGSGARLLLPVGLNDVVIPVYDDEPSSIIAHVLASEDYHVQLSNIDKNELNDVTDSTLFNDSAVLYLSQLVDEVSSELTNVPAEDRTLSVSGNRSPLGLDPLNYIETMNVRVSFTDEGALGKVTYTVTCYCAKGFDALRKICCPSELDFIRSLSRCKKWGAQGGKSNVFFAKSMDDRFVVKQVTKTELDSFLKFAVYYFKHLSEAVELGSATCLAKILGIYQVTSKHLKGGKDLRMDVLVMENLLYRRRVMTLYDLKGSSRSRYNADSDGHNRVLLDQNLIESLPTAPICIGNLAKRFLNTAVRNDTCLLASIDVMDYSLLVGLDEEKHELVVGIIDFMRQYTWDKHLETWVKASGILGGPKNAAPTVISPRQYKKRFHKAMSAYFRHVPGQA